VSALFDSKPCPPPVPRVLRTSQCSHAENDLTFVADLRFRHKEISGSQGVNDPNGGVLEVPPRLAGLSPTPEGVRCMKLRLMLALLTVALFLGDVSPASFKLEII
jgi:hypothetical protein